MGLRQPHRGEWGRSGQPRVIESQISGVVGGARVFDSPALVALDGPSAARRPESAVCKKGPRPRLGTPGRRRCIALSLRRGSGRNEIADLLSAAVDHRMDRGPPGRGTCPGAHGVPSGGCSCTSSRAAAMCDGPLRSSVIVAKPLPLFIDWVSRSSPHCGGHASTSLSSFEVSAGGRAHHPRPKGFPASRYGSSGYRTVSCSTM